MKWDNEDDKANFKMSCGYCHQIGTIGFRSPEEPVDWETMITRMDGFGGLYKHTQETIVNRIVNTYTDAAMKEWPAVVPPPAPTGAATKATITEWDIGRQDACMIHDLELGKDGKVYAVDMVNDAIFTLDPASGERAVIAFPGGKDPNADTNPRLGKRAPRRCTEVCMKKRDGGKDGIKELRRRAERRVRRNSPAAPPVGEADALKQLHELQVHQVELEMQNQELQRIRREVEAGLAHYTALYDLAPVGYFSLDRGGRFTRLNLTGARLLAGTRSEILGRRLADFVPAESRGRLAGLLEQVFESGASGAMELDLVVGEAGRLVVHVEAIADDIGASCRMALVAITARREAERRGDQLLIENRRLTQRLIDVQEAAIRFVQRNVSADDRVMVIGFDTRVRILWPTSDRALVERAISPSRRRDTRR